MLPSGRLVQSLAVFPFFCLVLGCSCLTIVAASRSAAFMTVPTSFGARRFSLGTCGGGDNWDALDSFLSRRPYSLAVFAAAPGMSSVGPAMLDSPRSSFGSLHVVRGRVGCLQDVGMRPLFVPEKDSLPPVKFKSACVGAFRDGPIFRADCAKALVRTTGSSLTSLRTSELDILNLATLV